MPGDAITAGNGFKDIRNSSLFVKPEAIAGTATDKRTNGPGSSSGSHPSPTWRASQEPFSLSA